jgi:site-specific DNA recombinase
MQQLIEMVEAGQVSTVIVSKLDRLTRSVADLDRLVKLFEKKNVAPVSLLESLDATTATGRLMMNLLASVSQWEREVIGERTKDAMKELKAQGKPYSRQVYADLEMISYLEAEYRQGRSYHELATELNTRGIQTARGGDWAAATVRNLVLR